jgi:DUF3015 family protein
MKKSIMLMSMALFSSLAAGTYAGTTDTGPGCGLGKLAWGDTGNNKHILQQVLIATTNSLTGTITFGISFGTSGCTNDGVVVQREKLNTFAGLNFEDLSHEIAQGRGEHLASLATLMGVPAEHHAAFFALAQENYASLSQAGEAAPIAMLTALQSAMAGHPVLAKLSADRGE